MAPKPVDKPAAEPAQAPAANGRHSFNADQRANERETAPITIGGVIFHRRRKTWEVSRTMRNLMREQERASRHGDRVRRQLDEAAPDASDDEIAELERKLDEASDAADLAAYKIVALLLEAEGGGPPDLAHLQEHLDVDDTGDLATMLAGGGEPVEGPTQTASTSS